MKAHGGRFERQVIDSTPAWAWARKVPDPPTRPFRCRCGGHPSTFTRGQPWDVELRWVSAGRHELLVECKSTSSKTPRLDFAKVDDWKAQDLAEAAAHGSHAGILWEYRAEPEYIAHYIPIRTWLELRAELVRKSLSLAHAEAYGIRVDVDAGRGRVHTYYQVGALLRRLETMEGRP